MGIADGGAFTGGLVLVASNLWAEKARALDRYRWRILRQRHSCWGALVRWVRDALVDFTFGLLVLGRLAHQVPSEPCDALLLQAAPKVIGLRRKKLLIAALLERGWNLQETALQTPMMQLRDRCLLKPSQAVPLRYLSYAAHAQWLVSRYQPSLLLNDRNGSLYSPFLRLALHAHQGLLVHLAHATTLESSRRLSMNDYDYYFLFGQSSLEALQARPVLFGCSQAVLSGSHMVDQAFDLPPASADCKTVLMLGVGPDKEKESGYLQTYRLIRDWAQAHPDWQLLIKSHPRSARHFWQQAAQQAENILLLPQDCTLAAALAQASVVFNIMSNAVIEAALARRPVLYLNCSGHRDIFRQAQFFGPCITDLTVLQQRVDYIGAHYVQALQQSAAFADYHLAYGYQGLNRVLALLEELRVTQRCSTGIPLSETD